MKRLMFGIVVWKADTGLTLSKRLTDVQESFQEQVTNFENGEYEVGKKKFL